MREPPEPPIATEKAPSASSIMVGAVDERGRLPALG
jgi:hypothetical protein